MAEMCTNSMCAYTDAPGLAKAKSTVALGMRPQCKPVYSQVGGAVPAMVMHLQLGASYSDDPTQMVCSNMTHSYCYSDDPTQMVI